MNTRMLLGWLPGMILAGGLAASGFAQNTPDTPPASGKPVAATPSPQAQSARVALSGASLDVQKLTEAGVGEAVVLAYITNSAAVYNLTPDKIIYLKGIGVSPRAIAAMIARDQQLTAEPPANLAAAPAPASLAVLVPEREGPGIVAADEDWTGPSIVADDEGYAPDQPVELGPVRAPYPVRLNDPIVIMKLPSFTIPCW